MANATDYIPTNDKVFEPMTGSDIPSITEDVDYTSPYDEDDPAYPIDQLMFQMAQQRKILMGILEFCKDSPLVADVNDEVDRLKEYSPNVYTAYDLCTILVEKGGLELLDDDGNPYDEDAIEPSIVEDEVGALYYEANDPADLHYHTTDAGQTILDDDDPLGRAQGFFDDDPDLVSIYKRVMKLCDGEGATLDALNEAVNDDELVQSPRIYAPFFIDRLERCDAIEWEGIWKLTDVGREALELISD